MANFYMTVGLPASGKDFLYEHHYKVTGAIHISSDAIREEVFGDVNDQSHNAEVFEIMKKRTIEALKAQNSVYYNATNLSAKRREAFLKNIEHIPNIKKICVLNVVPVDECIARNLQRERHVPASVIRRMLMSFQVPTREEGWDDIKVHGYRADGELENILENLRSESHDNPHHSLTVGEHMLTAESYYLKTCQRAPCWELILACRMHDCGKFYTKTFINVRGEETDIAHFYNHENVGAYIFLASSPVNTGVRSYLYIANLIQHHMDHFKGEKYLANVAEKFGEDFMADLNILHTCDLKAH